MGIKCPKCHSDNPDTQKFCGECGTQLKPAHAETRTLRTPAKDSPIGEIVSEKYKLLEELGSGGMGVVYKAEQIEPIKRSVALKIIKLGMDTKQVVARFETERQSLAVMDHPNIAKVFDGGATETGRPYFVMELVRGIPITEYCDRNKLTTRERLELFIHACEAIQHAHQKGIIHRDLKPSNILVVVQEDKPIPKIIDFGIAKATEHSLTERTLFTEQGQLIGTPEYMSPEQAEMSGLDVDTRTDIYSLGVILYELIVGVLPFNPESLRKAGFGEIQRVIRETDPPKASTRFSGLGDTQTSIAEHRKTDPSSLTRELKGDLDWITIKAMEKDRTRRYSTASDLATDIERHLKAQPIVARPPSNIYNVRKFISRHKFGVAMVTLLILAIVSGGAAATIGFVRAIRAERLTKKEAETAQQISNFLISLFKVSDPSEARGNSVTAREILDKGAKEINTTLKDQPELKARLNTTIGEVYTSLGLYEISKSHLEKAVQAQSNILGDGHLETLATIHALANVYWHLGRLNDAEKLYNKVVEAYGERLGEEHPKTLTANWDLASCYIIQKRYDEAEQLNLKILEIQRRVLGEEHPDTLSTMGNLSALYRRQRRYDDAEPICIKVLELRRRILGDKHPVTFYALENLGFLYYQLGYFDKAEPLYVECINSRRVVLGKLHPDTIKTIELLGWLYLAQERYDETETQLLSAYNSALSAFGSSHWQTQRIIKQGLIKLYEAWNKPEKAAEYRALLKESEIKK